MSDSGTSPTETPSADNSGCSGCGITLMLFVVAAILYVTIGEDDFYLQPGEANLSVEALQKTFDEIDRILPDTLVIEGELDPYQHYMSAESFGNLFYGLNPVIDVAAKSDTSRKYKFQYIARVDHVDINEFVIRDFLVDSIWRHQPFKIESKNPFIEGQ